MNFFNSSFNIGNQHCTHFAFLFLHGSLRVSSYEEQGLEGGKESNPFILLSSSISPSISNKCGVLQVQAMFPQGALTKKIKVGLQVNMFRPRKSAAATGLFKKITINHVPKKKRFCLIW